MGWTTGFRLYAGTGTFLFATKFIPALLSKGYRGLFTRG